ncbi:MAG: hypothetical protein GOV00_02160 [Candidatus Altiarchaeota archaeon]|nr:hypothetical protein [Candidatus Altiarchaeota archaeon]
MRVKKFMGLKLNKKMSDRATFAARLMVMSLLFFTVWMARPTFPLAKLATASLVGSTTGSEVVTEFGRYYITHNGFNLEIITDCVGWKEIFAFLALFIAWPRRKSWSRAISSLALILAYNLFRLDILVFSSQNFDYFHPTFQIVSMAVIIALWLWSVGVLGGKIKATSKKKKKRTKTVKKTTKRKKHKK